MAAREIDAVPIPRVFEHAVDQIVAAAGELWPGESVRLGEHVPSVRSYVHRITVGEHRMFAKYNMLGSSLVSVLRGKHGGWDRVLAAQRRYIQRRDGVLAREAEQLQLFTKQRQLRVCPLAGYAGGVLFTEAVRTGVALDEQLLAEPHHAAGLLRLAWAPLTRVHAAPIDGWPMIAERNIVDTFARKFLGPGGGIALGQLRRGVDPEVVAGLRYVVRRLRTSPAARSTDTLTFGEVKPEHIIVTGSEPVYLAPGVHVASPTSDLAKLVSRLLLVAISRVEATSARQQILAGLIDLIREHRSTATLAISNRWMVGLLTLIAHDAVNVLTTYLAAPPRIPVPRSVAAVVERTGVVVRVLEHVVTGLVQGVDPVEIWERLTAEVVGS